MKEKRNHKRLLAFILCGAFVLRIIGITLPDMYTDEVLMAFRAIENVDYDEAADQTTPLEWFDDTRTQRPDSIPWWTKVSFHDHPPLVFWTMHVSMKMFGENPFAVRLPSALLGVLAVYAMFLIGRTLWGDAAGLLSAFLLGVTTNHLYVSRLGLQESYLIAFGLMGLAAVLRAKESPTQYVWAGLWLGLAFLAKYNAILFIAMAALIVLMRKDWRVFSRYGALGMGIFLLVISPVLIYNTMLYRAVGHFDFQFSYVFGQNPEVWSVSPGKEIGSLGYRMKWLFFNLAGTHSPLFLLLAAAGGAIALRSREWSRESKLIGLGMLALAGAYCVGVIGVAYRFVAMLTPFLALLGGGALAWLYTTVPKKAFLALLVVVGIFEGLYGLNSVMSASPIGKGGFMYAEKTHTELEQTGYKALGRILERDLEGFRPAQVFSMQYAFLDRLHEKTIEEQSQENLPTKSTIIIYDPDVHNLAQLWYFDRLNIFHAWPALNIDQYAEYASRNGLQFPEANFKEHIVVIRAEASLSRRAESLNNSGEAMESLLTSRGLSPEKIYAPNGEEAFRVYRF